VYLLSACYIAISRYFALQKHTDSHVERIIVQIYNPLCFVFASFEFSSGFGTIHACLDDLHTISKRDLEGIIIDLMLYSDMIVIGVIKSKNLKKRYDNYYWLLICDS
jgi:hypothetical protein